MLELADESQESPRETIALAQDLDELCDDLDGLLVVSR